MRKKGLALILALMLGLTACGTGKEDEVKDYAGSTETVGTEQPAGTEQSAAGTIQAASEAGTQAKEEAKPKNGRDLIEQLGGEDLTFSDTFQAGQIPGKSEISYHVNNTTTLPSYKVTEIRKEDVKEAEIVKALFGDTAKEIRGNVSKAGRDSETVVEACENMNYEHIGDYQEENPQQEFLAWKDGDSCYWHTYEGTYLGMDSELLVGYDEDYSAMILAFGPKNWGDAIDHPECTEILSLYGTEVLYRGNEAKGIPEVEKDISSMADPANKCTKSPEDLASQTSAFLSEQLQLKLPNEPLEHKNAGDDSEAQILFFPDTAMQSENLSGAEVNGYRISFPVTLAGQEYYFDEFSQNPIPYLNQGEMIVTDKGVISGYMQLRFNFEDRLTDQVAILPFDKAMTAVQENVAAELDTSKVPSQSVELDEAFLRYYPVESPDKANEYTYIPVWFVPIQRSSAYRFAYSITNAMDGSLIHIGYIE